MKSVVYLLIFYLAVYSSFHGCEGAPLKCKGQLLHPHTASKNVAMRGQMDSPDKPVTKDELPTEDGFSIDADFQCISKKSRNNRAVDETEVSSKNAEGEMGKFEKWNDWAYKKKNIVVPLFIIMILLTFLLCCCCGCLCRGCYESVNQFCCVIIPEQIDRLTGRDPMYRTVKINMERLGLTPPTYQQFINMKDTYCEEYDDL